MSLFCKNIPLLGSEISPVLFDPQRFRDLLCFEISTSTKPRLLCSFLNRILMISALFAVPQENVLKKFMKKPVLA